jgi:hypothetical protein
MTQRTVAAFGAFHIFYIGHGPRCMTRSSISRVAFKISVVGLAAMVLALAVPELVTAQGASDPCALLADEEIGAVLDVKVSRHIGQGDLTTPNRATCTWVTAVPAQRGALAIGRVSAEARVQNKDFVQQVTQLGWKVEVADDTPSLWCGQLTPPPNQQSQTLPGPGARCEAVMKGFYMSLDVFSPTATAAKVKGLIDQIVARLP